MIKVLLGSVVAAVAMMILGFIFWATPLADIAQKHVDDPAAAEVQQSLAANLPETGSYVVPSAKTQAQTVMYGQGPISLIHYQSDGYPTQDLGSLIGGLILNFVVALLIGAGLIGIDRRVPDFGSRARLVVLIVLGAAGYMSLGQPIWMHFGWAHFIYAFIANTIILAAGGLIIARWFLPVKAEKGPARKEE
ncbi:MAG: hypothetical protein ACFBQW_06560 [Sphingomonadaceae bacterium]